MVGLASVEGDSKVGASVAVRVAGGGVGRTPEEVSDFGGKVGGGVEWPTILSSKILIGWWRTGGSFIKTGSPDAFPGRVKVCSFRVRDFKQ